MSDPDKMHERYLELAVWRAVGEVERLLTFESWRERTAERRNSVARKRTVAALLAGREAFGTRPTPPLLIDDPELLAIVAEQAKDGQSYRITKPWECSLDAPIRCSGYTMHDVIASRAA